MTSNEEFKLTYFNKRGGGEIIRLVFVTADKCYHDNRLELEDWEKIKKEMPMKNLPVLTVTRDAEVETFCQSAAIAKYLSRKFGLHGLDEEHALLIDEVYDSVGDVRRLLIQLHFSKEEPMKSELQQMLTSVKIPDFASYFDIRKSKYGRNGFIIGSTITLADLAVFNLIDGCMEVGFGSLWNSYPGLLKHRQDILKNEKIARWIDTRPKTEL